MSALRTAGILARRTETGHSPPMPRTLPFQGYNPRAEVVVSRRHLPHWTQEGATYFITFRLGDSVPQHLLRQWEEEREIWLGLHPQPWSEAVTAEFQKRFTDRMEEWLDAGMGACHLRDPAIRDAVGRHLLQFDNVRHDLDAFVLMPNHVHLLITPRPGQKIFELLKGLKGASARTCNTMLGRTGETFWMEDSYNRIVRNYDELAAFRRYIAANPEKAGLKPDESTLLLNNLLQPVP